MTKEEIKAYQKQYRLLNKERIRQKDIERYLKNKEYYREYSKKYRKEHPDKYEEYYKKRYVPAEKIHKGICPSDDGEIWEDINGTEGWYMVSNKGRVWSWKKGQILKQNICKVGYYVVSISYNNTPKTKYVHRLVAEAFIQNPNNYNVINHLDENKLNNHVDNLEWCTQSHNVTHLNAQNKRLISKGDDWNKLARAKAVLQFNLEGELINEYESASEVNRLFGYYISPCCRGEQKTAYGYIWKYK